MTRTSLRLLSLPLLAAVIAACTATGSSPSPSPTGSSAPSTSASAAASTSASASVNACDKSTLTTLAAGKLTVGTDNPAYPPYFQPPATGNATAPWELGDPTNGQGFESAVAYAVAGKLGYAKTDVAWTVVPFDNSYKPGTKPFDFYLAQVSYTADRAQAVDLSDGYYFVNQAIVALKANPISSAKTIADLKKYKFGAQQSTTAYDTITNVIAPTAAASVYNTNDDAISALKAKQIDALVVDLPTAFYITSAQLDNSAIVGQFPTPGGASAEHFSLVLAKGSPLTPCVNSAIAALKADVTLAQITTEWLSDKASAPVIAQ
jgi:polar amino acid transport system substrate-binding protein